MQHIYYNAIQAITEFFPISSTLHIICLGQILSDNTSTTDHVILHFANIVAICIYFRLRIKNILSDILHYKKNTDLIRCIQTFAPTVLVAPFLDFLLSNHLKISPKISLILSIIFGFLLIASLTIPQKSTKPIDQQNYISNREAVTLGLLQSIAIIPGVSRLGICLTFLLIRGYNLKKSYEYCLFISGPIFFGAFIFKKGYNNMGIDNNFSMIFASIVSIIMVYLINRIINLKIALWSQIYRIIFAMYAIFALF